MTTFRYFNGHEEYRSKAEEDESVVGTAAPTGEMMGRQSRDAVLESLVDYVEGQIRSQVSQSWIINHFRCQYIRSVQELTRELRVLKNLVLENIQATNRLRPDNLERILRADDAALEAAAQAAEARLNAQLAAERIQRILDELEEVKARIILEQQKRTLASLLGEEQERPDPFAQQQKQQEENLKKWRMDQEYQQNKEREKAKMKFAYIDGLKQDRNQEIERVMKRCGGRPGPQDELEMDNIRDFYDDLIQKVR